MGGRRVVGRSGLLGGGRTSVCIALALTAVLAGCAGNPEVTGSLPQAGARAPGPTIAFESVDGPPRPVFDRLVTALAAEAEARDLPVVSRTGPAQWRVRAYLATIVEKHQNRATLTWAWDVFDARQNLAFRLAGEQPLGRASADVWAQCDERVLARVAEQGFDALAARLGTPAVERPAVIAFSRADP